MEVRVLIENSQVGGIIGRKGANVKNIRETTGVYLSILKSDFRNVQERVMILKGPIESISVAAREVALLYVVRSVCCSYFSLACPFFCCFVLLLTVCLSAVRMIESAAKKDGVASDSLAMRLLVHR